MTCRALNIFYMHYRFSYVGNLTSLFYKEHVCVICTLAFKKFNMKSIKKNKAKVKTKIKTRKELRKAKRQEKKSNRNEYFSKKNKNDKKNESNQQQNLSKKLNTKSQSHQNQILQKHNNEKKQEIKLEREMQKQRKHNLQKENEKEDKAIKSLEKQLKLNKRKSDNIPKSFVDDGLDYLLEICDTETRKSAASVEKQFNNSDLENDFKEDFAIATGKKEIANKQSHIKILDEGISDYDSFSEESKEDLFSEDDVTDNSSNNSEDLIQSDNETEFSDLENSKKKKIKCNENKTTEKSYEENNVSYEESIVSYEESTNVWEDIYGRKRDNEGNLIKQQEKYLPPAVRARMIAEKSENTNTEKLNRLNKQIKGLLNRLAESNLINISSQIEQLYSNNSRHDMNSTLIKFIFEASISPVLTPFRQIANYALLITTLHANVDTEVGANFLQNIVLKFDTLVQQNQPVENKELENVVHIISQLYNLKIFHAQLLHEILWCLLKLDKKCENVPLTERCLECALLIFRTTGPTLRKDDPLALRNTILKMQDSVANTPEIIKESSRFKFLFDILMAIKNNNFTKIPNYNPDDIEHLRKVLRTAIRKGNNIVQLNILYEDLLKGEENGRWWIVGSAWSGQLKKSRDEDIGDKNEIKPVYNQEILELAQKQRMNTDIRRNIFCVVMSAEDYLDAFEKLLRLGLRSQQEREIVHVLLHCSLQEKIFNPYYALLLQRFCDYDRKYQIGIQCAIWDKLKEIDVYSSQKIKNLAKTLTYLFLQGGLPISVLKVVQLGELNKSLLRLFRQILLGVLLSDDAEASVHVWERIAPASSLRQFRQGLRLFIYHFLLKNSVLDTLPENDRELLKQRAKIAEKYLIANEQKVVF